MIIVCAFLLLDYVLQRKKKKKKNAELFIIMICYRLACEWFTVRTGVYREFTKELWIGFVQNFIIFWELNGVKDWFSVDHIFQ